MENEEDKVSFYKKLKPEFWLVLIILFSIIVRIGFFTGFSNIDQDDGIYINLMNDIKDSNLEYDNYAYMVKEGDINPTVAFALRPMMIYPHAYLQKLIGISNFSSSFFILLSSIGSVIIIYYLGSLFFNKKVGLVASFLIAILPVEVLYASQIMPDVQVAFFMGLSVLFFFLGERYHLHKKKSFIFFFISGISLGLGYLTKLTAVWILPLIFLYCLYQIIFKKRYNFYWLVFFGAFLLIFLLENIFYYSQTGEFFLRSKVMSDIYQTKYQGYGSNIIISSIPPIIGIYYHPPPILLYFLEVLANKFHPRQIYAGYLYYLSALALIFYVLSNLFKKKTDVGKDYNKNYRTYVNFLILWVFLLYLFLDFGPSNIIFNDPDSTSLITYKLLDKNFRFITILSIPLMILASYFLVSISRVKFKNISLGLFISSFLLIFLTITSFYYITINTNIYRNSLLDLREASKFLSKEDVKILYTDHFAIGIIDYYLGFDRNFEAKLLSEIPDHDIISDSYVILGGSRGYGIDYDYILELTPDIYESYYYEPPSNWKLKKEIKGPINDNRKQDMRLFYVD